MRAYSVLFLLDIEKNRELKHKTQWNIYIITVAILYPSLTIFCNYL